jgi:hypothetical protein
MGARRQVRSRLYLHLRLISVFRDVRGGKLYPFGRLLGLNPNRALEPLAGELDHKAILAARVDADGGRDAQANLGLKRPNTGGAEQGPEYLSQQESSQQTADATEDREQQGLGQCQQRL